MQRLFHFSVQKSFVLIPESYPEMMLLGFQQFLVDFGEQYHHVIEEKRLHLYSIGKANLKKTILNL